MTAKSLGTAELLLASISMRKGSGGRSSFLFNRPDRPIGHTGLGVTLYFNFAKLDLAALNMRMYGPGYLRFLSVSDIASMLMDFVRDHYYILAEDTYLTMVEVPFDQAVSPSAKRQFAEALANSCILRPKPRTTVFPLVPVQVQDDFHGESFSFLAPASLANESTIPPAFFHDMDPKQFPPDRRWEHRTERPGAWLAVPAPVERVAWKRRSAILGALALTPLPRDRYAFSLRNMFGGICTFGDDVRIAFGEHHTPGLACDIVLTTEDHEWLSIISQLIASEDRKDRRKLKALEYFYRAWFLDETERYPIHCMAIDALFGHPQNATQAVICGMQAVLGPSVEKGRLSLLMRIRGDVVHGRAPDVYDTERYVKYFNRYQADPIRDLELVTAKALSKEVFDDRLRSQPDGNEKFISALRAKGELPPDIPSILDQG